MDAVLNVFILHTETLAVSFNANMCLVILTVFSVASSNVGLKKMSKEWRRRVFPSAAAVKWTKDQCSTFDQDVDNGNDDAGDTDGDGNDDEGEYKAQDPWNGFEIRKGDLEHGEHIAPINKHNINAMGLNARTRMNY